jgi:hypothetical protein
MRSREPSHKTAGIMTHADIGSSPQHRNVLCSSFLFNLAVSFRFGFFSAEETNYTIIMIHLLRSLEEVLLL